MKKFKFFSTLVPTSMVMLVLFAFTIPVQAKPGMNKLMGSAALPVLSVNDQLAQAKKDGKAVFLVITGNKATRINDATKIANDAKSKHPKSSVITLNRDESSNSGLVAKFGIASAPVPLILVISHKGVPVAGLSMDQATADALVQAIPSPGQDEVLLAISEKKPVYMVVSKKGLADKTAVIANCRAASSKITAKPAVVEFDAGDKKEAEFLKQLGVTSVTAKTITIVVNASGQITDRFEGVAAETALAAAAAKVVRSGGCAPGACGGKSSCGPAKK